MQKLKVGLSASVVTLLTVISQQASSTEARTNDVAIKQLEISGEAIADSKLQLMVKRCLRDAPEISVRKCIEVYWVPVLLLARQTEEQRTKADFLSGEFFSTKTNQILYEALILDLASKEMSDQEREFAKKKRERLREKLKKPERIHLAHLYVHDSLLASELQTKLHEDLSIREFKELCRQYSKDQSTYQSGGDLGYVFPDGSTEYPEIKVPPALYQAAKELADGEFSAKPIAVPGGFSIIQRRGTLTATDPNDSKLKEDIERKVAVSIQAKRQESLLTQLREKHLKTNFSLLKKTKLNSATSSRLPEAAK